MYVIVGTVRLEPNDRHAFLESRLRPIEETRREAGCVEYMYGADPEDPGLVHVFEVWKGKEDVARHMKVVRERNVSFPPPVTVLSRTAVQYEVSNLSNLD